MSRVRRMVAMLAGAQLITCLSATHLTAHAGEPAIQPEAVETLRNSLEFIQALQAFGLETHSTIEVVLDSGQKLQFDTAVAATVQRPNRFHARRLGDLVNQEFFYDGRELTLADATAGYHATVDAPDSLEAMLDFARESLDIVAPAGDFLRADAFDILMADVETAFVVAPPAYIDGVYCDHLAFSSPGTDWQIWIAQGDRPLPRRIVITSRDIESAPQFSVHIREWELSPQLSEGQFSYRGQYNTSAIEFMRLDAGGNQ